LRGFPHSLTGRVEDTTQRWRWQPLGYLGRAGFRQGDGRAVEMEL